MGSSRVLHNKADIAVSKTETAYGTHILNRQAGISFFIALNSANGGELSSSSERDASFSFNLYTLIIMIITSSLAARKPRTAS